jgi:hypothetical protein
VFCCGGAEHEKASIVIGIGIGIGIASHEETPLLTFVRRRAATWHIAQRPTLAPTISGICADLHLAWHTYHTT